MGICCSSQNTKNPDTIANKAATSNIIKNNECEVIKEKDQSITNKNKTRKNSLQSNNNLITTTNIIDNNTKNSYDINNLNNNDLIIKINTLKKDKVSIFNNNNCNIIVFDSCFSVNVFNNQNCCIFIGPCKNIKIESCNNCTIVSISTSITANRNTNMMYSVFSILPPVLEKNINCYIGCFNFSYLELYDQIINKEILPWNNNWFNFSSIDCVDVKYVTDYQEFIIDKYSNFKKVLNNQEVPFYNVYSPIPLTFGKTIKNLENKRHMLYIINGSESNEAICEFCEEARLNKCYLIKSMSYSKLKDKHNINLLINNVESMLNENYKDDYEEVFDEFKGKELENINKIKKESNQDVNKNKIEFNSTNKIVKSLVDKNIIIMFWFATEDNDEAYDLVYELTDKFLSSFENRINLDSCNTRMNFEYLNQLFFKIL